MLPSASHILLCTGLTYTPVAGEQKIWAGGVEWESDIQHSTWRHKSDSSASLSLEVSWPSHQHGLPLADHHDSSLAPPPATNLPEGQTLHAGPEGPPLGKKAKDVVSGVPFFCKILSSFPAMALSSAPCSSPGNGEGVWVSNTEPGGLPLWGLGFR